MMKRVMYSLVLATVVCQSSFAQELPAQNTGPYPYENLPAAVMSEDVIIQPVPVMPAQPEAPKEMVLADEDNNDESVMPIGDELLTAGKSLINIGLDENKRKQVVSALYVLLSDEYLLYTKTFKYHWDVQGKHFAAMHEFFKGQYEALQGFSDGVAERIRMLGFMPRATFVDFAQFATLKEQPGHIPDDLGMIADLLKDHEQIIRNLRGYIDLTAKLDDMGTNNFLCDLIEKHEKMAWMLRAHLER